MFQPMLPILLAMLTPTSAGPATPPPPTAVRPPVLTLDEAVSQAWIPMLDPDKGQQIIIPVTLNGHIEQALLDTGAESVTIDSRRARELGLKAVPWGNWSGMSGPVPYDVAPIDSFELGGFRQRDGNIAVFDLSSLIAVSPHPFTMVIGAEFLKQVAIDFDFDAARLRFRRSGSRWVVGTDLPLTIKPSGTRFITAVSIEGQHVAPTVLDTGDNGTLAINDGIARQVVRSQRVSDAMQAVIGGRVVNRLFQARSVVFGSARIADVPVFVRTGEVLHDPLGPPSRAMIGLALLLRFNVTLDAPAGRLTLAPRLRPPHPDTVSTSGIQGLYQADGLAVVHVMRGSPAEAAGLKDGDRICQVDGAMVNAGWTPQQRGWSIGAPGRRVVLTRCDGRKVPIVLARFY